MPIAEVLDVPLTRIRRHPLNIRHDLGDLRELAASIRAKGVIEPLIVVPDPDARARNSFFVIAGNRRYEAAQLAEVKTVPCLPRAVDDAADQIETMLIENLQRTDLTPVEEARAYQTLLEFPGYTIKRITERTGRSAHTVKERIALGKLPDATLAKVSGGQMTLHDALIFVEFDGDPVETNRLEAAFGSFNWDFTVTAARARRDRAKSVVRTRKDLTTAGTPVLESFPANRSEWDEIAYLHLVPEAEADAFTGDAGAWAELEARHHQDCPGHTAVIGRDNQAIAYICTQPARHEATAKFARNSSEQDDPSQRGGIVAPTRGAPGPVPDREERRQLQQETVDLAIAAEVRTAYLAHRVASNDLTAAQATERIRQYLLDRIAFGATGRDFAAVLLGRPDLVGNRADDFAAVVAKLTWQQCVEMLGLLEFAAQDKLLADRHGFGVDLAAFQLDRTKEWRRRLADVYGYRWSDIERDLIALGEAQASRRATSAA